MNNSPFTPGRSVSASLSNYLKRPIGILLILLLLSCVSAYFILNGFFSKTAGVISELPAGKAELNKPVSEKQTPAETPPPTITRNSVVDSVLYDQKMEQMANGDSSGRWPVKTDYPRAGAILPFKRVIAFYGNLYSKGMGILGELPRQEMLAKLQQEITSWQAEDTTVEVIPALHYIAITAQLKPGNGGKYRQRMPFHQIDSVLSMAREIDALVFLDIQVGHSTLEEEIPLFEQYLKMPHVHLGIDPEFAIKTGHAPGKIVGSFDATDVNYATDYLSRLVKEHNLPPKMLVIHRFTQGMVTNYKNITTSPEVQLVMDMDGWGGAQKKINTYQQYIYKEPVQFTGFKLFYKNDTKSNGRLLTPAELLRLKPRPMYIQYQ